MGRIPLIRASQTEPFLGAVTAAGGRTTPLLEAAGIAPDVVYENPEALIPEYSVWELVDRCAAAAGSMDFGWDIGFETPIGDMGTFGQRVHSAPTLGAALETFLHAASQHSSHARFSVASRRGEVWFCRHGIDSIDVGAWQIELYVLGIMLHVVRLALGPAWAPKRVTLKKVPPRGARLPATLRDTEVRFGARVTSIQLPSAALGKPLSDSASRLGRPAPIEMPVTESVQLALRHSLPTGRADLEHTARLAGVTSRTLQRWLKEESMTFEDVLDDLRREEAVRRITARKETVARVASRLGYADPSNFTRAFRRWTGTAPSDYRAFRR